MPRTEERCGSQPLRVLRTRRGSGLGAAMSAFESSKYFPKIKLQSSHPLPTPWGRVAPEGVEHTDSEKHPFPWGCLYTGHGGWSVGIALAQSCSVMFHAAIYTSYPHGSVTRGVPRRVLVLTWDRTSQVTKPDSEHSSLSPALGIQKV